MRPRSIGLIPSLPANTKLSKVEQNTHMAMQLRCRACPNSADNPPLPQPCKEVLHLCTIEAMHIVILLLVFTQSFPTNIRRSGVQEALIGAVMCTYFKFEKRPMCSQRTTLIPNHNIRGGSQHKVTYTYYIPKIVHSHGYLINMACVLGIEKDIRARFFLGGATRVCTGVRNGRPLVEWCILAVQGGGETNREVKWIKVPSHVIIEGNNDTAVKQATPKATTRHAEVHPEPTCLSLSDPKQRGLWPPRFGKTQAQG